MSYLVSLEHSLRAEANTEPVHLAITVSHVHIGAEAGYEYYAVDFGPPLNLSRHAILIGLSLSWAFSG